MANQTANRFLLEVATLSMIGDYRAILMNETFEFDKDSHRVYADIAEYELETGNGYTQGGEDLQSKAITEFPGYDWVDCSWATVSFEASGGDIGPLSGVVIVRKLEDEYDEYDSEIIVGFLEMEDPYTILNEGKLEILVPTARFR